MHLRRLEAAGQSAGVSSCRTTARRCGFFEVTPFAIDLTPDLVGEAARTLDDEPDLQTNSGKEVKP
jgi:hypothetical protein